MNDNNDISLTILYKDYAIRIYRYMFARVHKKELAEDLASTCILKIVKNKDKINTAKNINAWIFTIAHNVLVDFYRQNSRIGSSNLAVEEVIDREDHIVSVESDMMLTEILRRMQDLNAEEREVIELTYFAQLEPNEIAQIIKRPLTTIRTIRFRALNKLKKLLAA